jgi:hypothetical protein
MGLIRITLRTPCNYSLQILAKATVLTIMLMEAVYVVLYLGQVAMSIVDIIPEVRALSRGEKFQLAQILLEDLANEDLPLPFKPGQVFPIHTPPYVPGAAAQLAKALADEGNGS